MVGSGESGFNGGAIFGVELGGSVRGTTGFPLGGSSSELEGGGVTTVECGFNGGALFVGAIFGVELGGSVCGTGTTGLKPCGA